MRLGPYSFHAESGDLGAGTGAVVDLKPNARTLLATLVAADENAVSNDTLMQAISPDVTVSEDSLYQGVAELRRALAEDGDLVQTVPRAGYRLVKATAVKPVRRIRPRWAFGAAGLVLGALIVGVAMWLIWPSHVPDYYGAPSIAVLPFDSQGDERSALFATSLATEVAGNLQRNR